MKDLDPGVERLVNALNEFEAICTTSSCAGHEESDSDKAQMPFGKFYVDFEVDYNKSGWKALEYVVTAIETWVKHREEGDCSLIPWMDGGLRWHLKGEYIDQGEIDDLAEIVERIDCPGVLICTQ